MTQRAARRWYGRVTVVIVGLSGLVVGLSGGRPAEGDAVLRIVVVGEMPTAVVVDTQRGRTFITTTQNGAAHTALGPAGGHVWMLDTQTGARLNTVGLGGAPRALGIDERTGRLFVATGGGAVAVLDAGSGALVRIVPVGWTPLALAVDARTGRAYIVGGDGSVTMLDGWSGRVLRRVRVGAWAADIALDGQTDRVFVASRDADGVGHVSVLAARSLALQRTLTLAAPAEAIAVDTRRNRLVALQPSHTAVSVVDVRNGALLGLTRVSHAATAVVVDERSGQAFVAAARGRRIGILDTVQSRLVRTVRVGRDPASLLVDGARGRVYVTLQSDGIVSILDARTGVVRQTISVGPEPRAVAVDEARARVIVATWGATAPAQPEWWTPWVRQLHCWLPGLALPQSSAQLGGNQVTVLDAAHM